MSKTDSTTNLSQSVRNQIAACSKILAKLERFKPVVAGGALCSWMSNQLARDIDIWIDADNIPPTDWLSNEGEFKDTLATILGSEHSVRACGDEAGDVEWSTSRGLVEVFKTDTASTSFDIVIYSERDGTPINGFDWTYSAMSWGWDPSFKTVAVNTIGLDDFAKGELRELYIGDCGEYERRSRQVAENKTSGYSAFGTGIHARRMFDTVAQELLDAYPRTPSLGETCPRCGAEWRVRQLMFSSFEGCLC